MRAASNAFLACFGFSATSCTVPVAPCAVPRRARILTLALPSVLAIAATAPGRLSTVIVNCLVLAMEKDLLYRLCGLYAWRLPPICLRLLGVFKACRKRLRPALDLSAQACFSAFL